MELTRQYKNADGDDIRVDVIMMQTRQNTIASRASEHTYNRILKVRSIYSSAISDRVVATIEIITDSDSIETSTGNFNWAKWNSPVATLDMSDLPSIGDTV